MYPTLLEEMCPDFPITCHNDGYVSYIDGQCRCRCPEGLDHNTGCATHVGAGMAINSFLVVNVLT